jgi:hypothetical protein
MHTRTALSMAILLSVCASQLATADTAPKGKLRKARKILEQVKLVDGAGSGLNADTVRGITPLIVVDSMGSLVGAVMELDGNYPQTGAYVVRRIDSTPVLFHASAAGLDNSEQFVGMAAALFESTDCSGSPLVPADVTAGFYPVRAGVAGTTAYYANGPATTRTIRSQIYPRTSCLAGEIAIANGACCAPGGPYTESFQEAVKLDLATLGLVPPFRIDTP